MRTSDRKTSTALPHANPLAPAQQELTVPAGIASAASREAVTRYVRTIKALGALQPTLPTLVAVVTTVDERRRGEILHVLREAVQAFQDEQSQRKAIQRLPLPKRVRGEVAKVTRLGAELNKRTATLVERAEQVFAEGKGIPAHPALLSSLDEQSLFKGMVQNRERFWTALHMVPFVREHVLQELKEKRASKVKISMVVMSPRSRGKTESQLARHVDANIATVTGMLARDRGAPGYLNSAKIATLLVETPLVAERLTEIMGEVRSRTEEMRAVHTRLNARHGALSGVGVSKDPEHSRYCQLREELGGELDHAELQLKTLVALSEPYRRIKDYMVNANIRLVGKIVCGLERSRERQEELMQDGVLGLMRAIEKFDGAMGFRLSTVATWWIRQAVFRKRPEYYHLIGIPVHRVEAYMKIVEADSQLERVTDAQLGKRLRVEPDVIQGLRRRSQPLLSFSRQEDHEERSLEDIVPDRREEQVLDSAGQLELRERINAMLRRIHPRTADILSKRFGLNGAPLTLDQIARQLGITRERVRQIEAKALSKIRGGPLAKMLEDFA